MLLISSFKDERSCILFFNRQLWFVKEPQGLGFWLGFRLAIAECDKICPNYPKLKVTIAATRAMEHGVLRWSCPNPHDSCRPFRRATSCHIWTSLLPLWSCYRRNCSLANVRCWENLISVCLGASSLYLVFTLKRLQTVIRLIRPACYFLGLGCLGFLARCPGFRMVARPNTFDHRRKRIQTASK